MNESVKPCSISSQTAGENVNANIVSSRGLEPTNAGTRPTERIKIAISSDRLGNMKIVE